MPGRALQVVKTCIPHIYIETGAIILYLTPINLQIEILVAVKYTGYIKM